MIVYKETEPLDLLYSHQIELLAGSCCENPCAFPRYRYSSSWWSSFSYRYYLHMRVNSCSDRWHSDAQLRCQVASVAFVSHQECTQPMKNACIVDGLLHASGMSAEKSWNLKKKHRHLLRFFELWDVPFLVSSFLIAYPADSRFNDNYNLGS